MTMLRDLVRQLVEVNEQIEEQDEHDEENDQCDVFEHDTLPEGKVDLATILETGAGALADIDIASDGTIAAGGAPNNVVLSDTSLAAVTLTFGIATGSTVFVDIREPSL